jgi:hypothetical protein
MKFTKPAIQAYLEEHNISITNYQKTNKAKLYGHIVSTWDDLQDNSKYLW